MIVANFRVTLVNCSYFLWAQTYLSLDADATEPVVQRDSIDDTMKHQDEPQLGDAALEFAPAPESGSASIDAAQVSRSSASASADSPQGSADVPVDESGFENAVDDKASRSSSAMDESVGSDGDNADKAPIDETPMVLEDSSIESNPWAVEPDSAEPEPAASQDSDVQLSVEEDQSEVDKSNGREGSRGPAASDAYEPPEPSIGSNSPYSPPFSPAPPGSAEQRDIDQHPGVSTEDVDELMTSDQHEAVIPVEMTKVGFPL